MENRAPSSPRGPRRRDRRGRGMRGPGVLPRTPGRPETRTARERFDDLVLAVVTEVDGRWADRLGVVEYAVEDAPDLPDDWDPATVPLGSAVRGTGDAPSRVVVFRRPIEHRAESRSELDALVLTVVVEQVADLLNVDPQVIDPRYESD
ncbi:metallopeptidase family protein [Nocardioides sp. SOB77]|uniref:Metallopeptidase family protein n=1 Tax=Nocardioides oceani TaxID=3058369 RepID=A0ABT8FLI7_9ACTN|nr:metallopeptidase family protein [Nocardioides oceani]MDN4175017.1 metallopeptidase family protein [Nocardioides oceani]